VPNGINKHSQHATTKTKVMSAAGQKSSRDDDTDGESFPNKKETSAQDEE
jgi:hypothetical protein